MKCNRRWNDARTLIVATTVWLAFIAVGGAAWWFFVPLMLVSLIVPGVVASLFEAPRMARPFLAVVPNLLAAVAIAALGNSDWIPWMLQIILGAALLQVVIQVTKGFMRNEGAVHRGR